MDSVKEEKAAAPIEEAKPIFEKKEVKFTLAELEDAFNRLSMMVIAYQNMQKEVLAKCNISTAIGSARQQSRRVHNVIGRNLHGLNNILKTNDYKVNKIVILPD